jgi:hypothetical protein
VSQLPWKIPTVSLEKIQVCTQIADLRTKGWSYRDIGAKYGMSPADAQRCAVTGASVTPPDNARMIRKMAEDQVMAGIRTAFAIIDDPPYAFAANGTVITDPVTGKPMRDIGAVLAAVTRLYEGVDRLCKLNGTYVARPTLSVIATMSAAEIRAVTAKMTAEAAEIESGAPVTLPVTLPGEVLAASDDGDA